MNQKVSIIKSIAEIIHQELNNLYPDAENNLNEETTTFKIVSGYYITHDFQILTPTSEFRPRMKFEWAIIHLDSEIITVESRDLLDLEIEWVDFTLEKLLKEIKKLH